jgi:hypothetical protein
MMKRLIPLILVFCIGGNAYGGTLAWKTSKAEAVSAAISGKKMILLLAGRETCGNCSYMTNTVCESVSPPIQTLIQEKFVPWLCNLDSSNECNAYDRGLDGFYLPLICCINPTDPDNYLDRTTGAQSPEEFYVRLLSIIGRPLDPKDDLQGNGKLAPEDVTGIHQTLSVIQGKWHLKRLGQGVKP